MNLAKAIECHSDISSEVYHLPELFNGGINTDAYFHFYSAEQSSVKNKVIFSQNVLSFQLQGVKEVYNHISRIQVNNQQILLCASSSVLMSESTPQNEAFKSILLFFSNAFLTNFCIKHHVTFSSKPETILELLTIKKDDFLYNFETSLQLLKNTTENGLQQVKLEEVLLYLLQAHPEKIVPFIQSALLKQPLLKLKQTVLQNIESNLTVEELAFLCNMSLSSFKRHFAETFETSPKKYFTIHKMEKAKQLLALGQTPSVIYITLGYESLSAFSSEFKKQVGISPTQYRAKMNL